MRKAPRHASPSNRRRSRRWILPTVLAIIAVLAAIALYIVLLDKPILAPRPVDGGTLKAPVGAEEQKELEEMMNFQTTSENLKKKEHYYTVIIAGQDRISGLTDVLMLMSYDMDNGAVNFLQVPRDTYVKMKKGRKINSAYNRYGREGLYQIIRNTLGIDADRMILIDLKGFVEVVDAIGGVEIDVPKNLRYSDPYQNLKIDIKKGLQVLDGKQAEGFVRFRSDGMGDLGRIERQKLFLKAFAQKLFSITTVAKIPTLVDAIKENTKSDFSTEELLFFAKNAFSLKAENFQVFSIPGEAFMRNNASYFGIHEEEALEMINRYFNPYTTDITDLDIVEFTRRSSTSETNTDPFSLGDAPATSAEETDTPSPAA
jgi:LCP family protein required for cell wall assembly